jgi:hypothetical protein
MASVTFDRFDAGLLLARPSSVAPANSLSAVRNMDVQPGGWLRSRPKWRKSPGGLEIPPQWKGLESNAGYLWVFSCWPVASTGKVSDIVNAETGERVVYAFRSTGTGGNFADAARACLLGVTRWDTGFFAALSPDQGATVYPTLFSVNTSTHTVTATSVTDVNCPKSGLMATATERVYAISDDGQSVRYSKVGDPTDWTTASNAGFLPVSRHFGGSQRAYGLGLYQGQLAVFGDQSIQLWNIDPDPTAIALDRVIGGVGTRHHRSIVSLNGDVLFLSGSGVRSLTTPANALFPSDVDLGLPIRNLTVSPTGTKRFSLGSNEPSVIALGATPMSQYWVSAPNSWSR